MRADEVRREDRHEEKRENRREDRHEERREDRREEKREDRHEERHEERREGRRDTPARTPAATSRTSLAMPAVFPHSAIPGMASRSRLVTMHFLPMPCLTFGNPARHRHAWIAVKTRRERTMEGRNGYASAPLRQERKK